MLMYISSALFHIMEIINPDGKSGLILGDVNICLMKYGTNDTMRLFSWYFVSRVFLGMHKPNKVTHTSATVIDSNLNYKDTL